MALTRESARAEKIDLPASSTALLAVRVVLSAPWPEKKKINFFFDHFLNSGRRVELRDEDETGHVPVTADCSGCSIVEATSGVPDGSLVRGASTPLRVTIRL